MNKKSLSAALKRVSDLKRQVSEVSDFLLNNTLVCDGDPYVNEGGLRRLTGSKLHTLEQLQYELVQLTSQIAHANNTVIITIRGLPETITYWLGVQQTTESRLGVLRSVQSLIKQKKSDIGKSDLRLVNDTPGTKQCLLSFSDRTLVQQIQVLEKLASEIKSALSKANSRNHIETAEQGLLEV